LSLVIAKREREREREGGRKGKLGGKK